MIQWLQRRRLWLLLAAYTLGLVAPRWGVAMRDIGIANARVAGATVVLSVPMLMLGFLLLTAGLGTDLRALTKTIRRPGMLLAGLTANVTFPIVFAGLVSLLLGAWPGGDEVQDLLVGLAVIGAMPIAGSSTAWTQNADGNLALSLGLVLASTALSPWLTPLGLHAIGAIVQGDHAADLHQLAHRGSSAFVAIGVVLPSLCGVGLRALVGAERATAVAPVLKALSLIVLLWLSYSNASVALPSVVRQHDWDYLALSAGITTTMCAGAFVIGRLVPWLCGGSLHCFA